MSTAVEYNMDAKYPLPPNFSGKDLFFIKRFGAIVRYEKEDGLYVTNATDTVLNYLDELWAVNSVQK